MQELIAPRSVEFYDQAWQYRGDKTELTGLISSITNIDRDVLLGLKSLETIPVARRMAWAAFRNTTREEDVAYCLLGIFGVNLPMIYGEGSKAFIRLQEEIIKQTNDLSIFSWLAEDQGGHADETGPVQFRGVLATSPREFKDAKDSAHDRLVSNNGSPEFIITNKGIRIDIPLFLDLVSGLFFMPLESFGAGQHGRMVRGICLKRYGDGEFARAMPNELPELEAHSLLSSPSSQRYLTRLIPRALDLYVANSKTNLFAFRWDFGSPYYHHIFAKPHSGWSEVEKAFVTHDGPFLGVRYFSSSWATPYGTEFVLVFGKGKHWMPPWFCIWKQGDPMYETALVLDRPAEVEAKGEAEFQRNGPSKILELVRDSRDLGVPGEMASSIEAGRVLKCSVEICLSSSRPTTYGGWHVGIFFGKPVISFHTHT